MALPYADRRRPVNSPQRPIMSPYAYQPRVGQTPVRGTYNAERARAFQPQGRMIQPSRHAPVHSSFSPRPLQTNGRFQAHELIQHQAPVARNPGLLGRFGLGGMFGTSVNPPAPGAARQNQNILKRTMRFQRRNAMLNTFIKR